jgi:hypothetical protein
LLFDCPLLPFDCPGGGPEWLEGAREPTWPGGGGPPPFPNDLPLLPLLPLLPKALPLFPEDGGPACEFTDAFAQAGGAASAGVVATRAASEQAQRNAAGLAARNALRFCINLPKDAPNHPGVRNWPRQPKRLNSNRDSLTRASLSAIYLIFNDN